MAVIQIPLRNDLEAYDFSVDLDGRTFNFDVSYNTRTTLWALTISDSNLNQLIGGIPLVVNTDLIGRFKNEELPQGILMLFDTSGANRACGKLDLGSRCVLIYEEVST